MTGREADRDRADDATHFVGDGCVPAHPPLAADDKLTYDEVELLARYNAEKYRGLVHTAEWVERMDELQRRFDRERGRVR